MYLVGSWFPDQGSSLRLLVWKHRVIITEPPGTSQEGKGTSIRKRKNHILDVYRVFFYKNIIEWKEN